MPHVQTYNIVLLPGDGVGPEVTAAARGVLSIIGDFYGHDFQFTEHLIGGAGIDATGDPLPPETTAACLAADGTLAPGAEWIQESILGTTFTASYAWAAAGGAEPRSIVPTITGRASVTARGELVLDPADPFCWGRRDGP